jgi:uncharacterized protein Yka (UPF0111/DUF47 family)
VRLLPKDEEFFKMFAELASRITGSAKLLHSLFSEPERLHDLVGAIKQLEHEADGLTHDVIERIDTTFITPIDREDIHLLASRLDDVIDIIDGTARRAQMFGIRDRRQAAVDLAAILVRASEAVEGAVAAFKKPKIVVQVGTQVKRLEEDGDMLYHEAMGRLFEGRPDPLEVIKWKELYDMLESTIDQCEDVANTLESIALKNN